MTHDFHLADARKLFLNAGRTIENVRRDFPEWHRNRPRYVLWALDVDSPPVRQVIADATSRLDGLLLEGYARQAHITLALGGFPDMRPIRPDDYGPAALQAHVEALQTLALTPFQICIGGLASFSSAPFLAVHDAGGSIRRLRKALHPGSEHPGGPYLPHVTVGLYYGSWPVARVQPALDAVDCTSPVPCTIERISLMAYTASEIGGPLSILADFDLRRGELDWRGKALFSAPDALHAPHPEDAARSSG